MDPDLIHSCYSWKKQMCHTHPHVAHDLRNEQVVPSQGEECNDPWGKASKAMVMEHGIESPS